MFQQEPDYVFLSCHRHYNNANNGSCSQTSTKYLNHIFHCLRLTIFIRQTQPPQEDTLRLPAAFVYTRVKHVGGVKCHKRLHKSVTVIFLFADNSNRLPWISHNFNCNSSIIPSLDLSSISAKSNPSQRYFRQISLAREISFIQFSSAVYGCKGNIQLFCKLGLTHIQIDSYLFNQRLHMTPLDIILFLFHIIFNVIFFVNIFFRNSRIL